MAISAKKVTQWGIGILAAGVSLGLALAVAAVAKPVFDRFFSRVRS